MKKLIIILLSVIYNTQLYAQQYGSFTDSRDGKIYKTVKIGNQEWMAENLNVVTFRNGDSIQEAKNDEEWHKAYLNGTPVWRKKILDSDTIILYNWYTINDKRGLAPKGYHIPSNDEWAKLINFLGGKKLAAKKLKASQGWPGEKSRSINNNGTNSSGFNALPGWNVDGEDDNYWLIGKRTLFWSSTEDTFDNSKAWAWGFMVLWDGEDSVLSELWNKHYEFPVRCLKIPISELRVKNEQIKESNENKKENKIYNNKVSNISFSSKPKTNNTKIYSPTNNTNNVMSQFIRVGKFDINLFDSDHTYKLENLQKVLGKLAEIGWRLPTINECYEIEKNINSSALIFNDYYWTSSINDHNYPILFSPSKGRIDFENLGEFESDYISHTGAHLFLIKIH